MGDPHPEDLIQRMLDELVATAHVPVKDITDAREGWAAAAAELREIAKLLNGDSTQSLSRQAAWVGTASESATAAFDALAEQFLTHADGLDGVALALKNGEQVVLAVTQRIATDIGTELKAKKKGGLFGSGIGPSLGPDVVEFVDDVADGVGAVAKNPVAIVNKGLLIGSPLAALAVAGDTAEHQQMSRADQMNAIKELHDGLSFQMSSHDADLVSAASESTGAEYRDGAAFGNNLTFGDSGTSGGGAGAFASSGYGGSGRHSSGGDPRLGPFASTDRSHATIGDTMPSLSERITADGGMSTGSSSSSIDLSPDRYDASGPGGAGGSGSGGLSGAGGAAAGAGAAAAGIGGGLGGALGGARAAGGSGGLGAAPGMLGGATGGAGGPGAKGGGLGMLGQGMGGGAGGGGDKKGGGKRYGDGPELGPRDRRNRGPKHAVLGAGSRGAGGAPDDAAPNESDDPFYDGG